MNKSVIRQHQQTPYCKARWENGRNSRYYQAIVEHDFFDWVLVCVWGRKGTALGGMRKSICKDYESGVDEIMILHKRRLSREYHLVQQEGLSRYNMV